MGIIMACIYLFNYSLHILALFLLFHLQLVNPFHSILFYRTIFTEHHSKVYCRNSEFWKDFHSSIGFSLRADSNGVTLGAPSSAPTKCIYISLCLHKTWYMLLSQNQVWLTSTTDNRWHGSQEFRNLIKDVSFRSSHHANQYQGPWVGVNLYIYIFQSM